MSRDLRPLTLEASQLSSLIALVRQKLDSLQGAPGGEQLSDILWKLEHATAGRMTCDNHVNWKHAADLDLPGCGRHRWSVHEALDGQWIATAIGPAAAGAATEPLGQFATKEQAMERCRIDAHKKRRTCADRTVEGRR